MVMETGVRVFGVVRMGGVAVGYKRFGGPSCLLFQSEVNDNRSGIEPG